MMNGCGWVDGLGKGCGRGSGLGGAVCVWCWDSIGKAVDVPTQHYSTYPHPIPIQHQSSQPTANARLTRPHFHHLAQTHTHHTYPTSIPPNSTPESTLLQPTRPDPRPHQKRSVHYPTNRHTLSPPNRPTPTPQPDPTTPLYPPQILS